jgi:hypothetical protein
MAERRIGNSGQNVERRRPNGRRRTVKAVDSDDSDVLGFFALSAGCDIEFDDLPLIEGLVTVTRDVGVVDEHIVALLTRNEAEALFAVEEFHCSLHSFALHICTTLWRVRIHDASGPSPAALHRCSSRLRSARLQVPATLSERRLSGPVLIQPLVLHSVAAAADAPLTGSQPHQPVRVEAPVSGTADNAPLVEGQMKMKG